MNIQTCDEYLRPGRWDQFGPTRLIEGGELCAAFVGNEKTMIRCYARVKSAQRQAYQNEFDIRSKLIATAQFLAAARGTPLRAISIYWGRALGNTIVFGTICPVCLVLGTRGWAGQFMLLWIVGGFCGALAICLWMISNYQLGRLERSIRDEQCPDCYYQLAKDAALLTSICPECGVSWPLVPPEWLIAATNVHE